MGIEVATELCVLWRQVVGLGALLASSCGMRVILAIAVSGVAACGHEAPRQAAPVGPATSASGSAAAGSAEASFVASVQALCDIPDHVPDGDGPEQRLAGLAEWTSQHATDPRVRSIGDPKSLSSSKQQLADAVKEAGIDHCKLLELDMQLQSFADAMHVVCNAPQLAAQTPEEFDKRAKYLKSHLLNTDVVRMLGSFGMISRADAEAKIHDAMTRAGMTSCAALTQPVQPPEPPPSASSKPVPVPEGRISIASKKALDDSTLTADMVVQKVESVYMGGLKHCYKTQLANDREARGKVTLELTVDAAGHTGPAAAHGFADPLDACMTNLMASWRFPIPKDKAATATKARFTLALLLVPS